MKAKECEMHKPQFPLSNGLTTHFLSISSGTLEVYNSQQCILSNDQSVCNPSATFPGQRENFPIMVNSLLFSQSSSPTTSAPKPTTESSLLARMLDSIWVLMPPYAHVHTEFQQSAGSSSSDARLENQPIAEPSLTGALTEAKQKVDSSTVDIHSGIQQAIDPSTSYVDSESQQAAGAGLGDDHPDTPPTADSSMPSFQSSASNLDSGAQIACDQQLKIETLEANVRTKDMRIHDLETEGGRKDVRIAELEDLLPKKEANCKRLGNRLQQEQAKTAYLENGLSHALRRAEESDALEDRLKAMTIENTGLKDEIYKQAQEIIAAKALSLEQPTYREEMETMEKSIEDLSKSVCQHEMEKVEAEKRIQGFEKYIQESQSYTRWLREQAKCKVNQNEDLREQLRQGQWHQEQRVTAQMAALREELKRKDIEITALRKLEEHAIDLRNQNIELGKELIEARWDEKRKVEAQVEALIEAAENEEREVEEEVAYQLQSILEQRSSSSSSS